MLDVDPRSGVTVIRLNHGKVNALDLELLRALAAAVRALDPATALVLTGTGRVFSAGVDLHAIVAGGEPYVREFLPALSDALVTVFEHPGPVVAAVDGHAIAGGCVIAAAADVRLMAQGTIGLAELSVGVSFPTAALEIMRHAVGPAAGRLVLTAELLDPAQAQAIGLVHEITEPDRLLDAAIGRARRMAAIAAPVFAFSKAQWQQPARDRIAAGADLDATVADMWSSDATLTAIVGYVDALRRRPR